MHQAIFKAIADPTRRQIIDVVSAQQHPTITSVSENFKMSRQAVTKHINILNEAGIITVHKHGREKQLHFNYNEIKKLYEWLNKYEKFWKNTADRLGEYLEKSN